MSETTIEELLQACAAQPQSAFLVRTLLAEAAKLDGWRAADYLQAIAPEPFEAALRHQVSEFLREAGRDEAADAWRPGLRVAATPEGHGTVVPLHAKSEAENRTISPAAERLTLADVGGLETVKREIRRRIITPFQKPGLFAALKRRAGGGVLMYGPPGCGKTMLARATAGETGAAFIQVEIADVLDMWIGQSEKHIAEVFEEARAKKPCVVFFDELEALAGQRHFGGVDHKSSIVSAFLSAFDGLSSAQDGVLVLGATNVPWAIDNAFRRPGRFDRVLFVPPPDREGRLAILQRLMSGRPAASNIDLGKIAAKTSSFSGADLTSLIETAIDLVIEETGDSETPPLITMRHLEEALTEVRPTTLEWLTTARNYAKHANQGGLYDEVKAFLERNAR